MTVSKQQFKTIEKNLNRRTEYQRLLKTVSKSEGLQPWVKSPKKEHR